MRAGTPNGEFVVDDVDVVNSVFNIDMNMLFHAWLICDLKHFIIFLLNIQ